ncbi:HD domain-containing protein [Streptomyces sp. NPDC005566]|uniref:HD domain-containing protein n=1 Tax=Streptomyces sp. NPDC005566 TaxID=3156886 RepID=UPI0033BD1B24
MTRSSGPLSRALSGPADPPLRLLPQLAAELLLTLRAPARLAAHLRAVHDVAHQLIDRLQLHCPAVDFDREAVLFGAATHDIGKTVCVDELSGPGSAHEEVGRELLLEHGFPEALARFAGTHASWAAPSVGVEDLLVSTADKIWKNRRVPGLEDLVIARLVGASGNEPWEEFLALDAILTPIGQGADARLAFQASFPVHH